jgi:small redox-active disulfide protein 2
MKLQIYGSGCNKCRQLYENAEAAAKLTGNQVELEKITDLNAIVDAGILITPAFAVDGKVISKGKVLSVEEIAALIGAPAPTPCACANPHKSPLRRGLTFFFWELSQRQSARRSTGNTRHPERRLPPGRFPIRW